MDGAVAAAWTAAGVAVLAAGVSAWQAVHAGSAANSAKRQAKAAEEQLALAWEQHVAEQQRREQEETAESRNAVREYLRRADAYVNAAHRFSRRPAMSNLRDDFALSFDAVLRARKALPNDADTTGFDESSLAALIRRIGEAADKLDQVVDQTIDVQSVAASRELQELISQAREVLKKTRY
ncbi:hypothetical protein ACQP00_06210 [Dactylosporangium sp. CS-047395]|uniref:hypothetical protein n=1 Tax=Dactylosporangium sp. CS-047395 TaxID=3239936 RepID=UPI003D8DEFF3